MPSRLELVKTPAGSVPNANPGEVNGFIDDADGLWKTKDEAGVVSNQSASSADELNNASANPTILTAGPEPTAVDMVLATTAIGPPHAAAYVNPRVRKMSTTVLQLAAVVNAVANKNAVIDELVRMAPGVFAADQTVTLPALIPAYVDREIWVKIIGVTGGFKVSIVGAVSGDVDGLLNGDPDLDLTTDRQFIKLRCNLEATSWMILG